MTTIDLRNVKTPEEEKRHMDEGLKPARAVLEHMRSLPLDDVAVHSPETAAAMAVSVADPPVNRGHKREMDGQSGLPRFDRYSIPEKPRPGEVECPYCVKRPLGAKGLRDHCRAVHPDKPEAR